MSTLYEAIRTALNSGEPYARHFGIAIDEVRANYARASMPFDERHRDAFGELHDSAVYTLVDMVFGGVLFQEGVKGVTLRSHAAFFGKCSLGPVIAEARGLASCGKLATIDVRVTDGTGNLIASVSMIGYTIRKKVELT